MIAPQKSKSTWIDGVEYEIKIVTPIVPITRCQLAKGLYFESEHDWPNPWFRFWQWFLLGWKWERVR